MSGSPAWPSVALSLLDATAQQQHTAQEIRARLGAWPSATQAWRIKFSTSLGDAEELGAGVLLLVLDTPAASDQLAQWLATGASVLVMVGHSATLYWSGACYRLSGQPAHDWLAAWAAFLDCGFAPHDALCLAWAWRPPTAVGMAEDWPFDLASMPRVLDVPQSAADAPAFPPCPSKIGLYPVVPDAQWVERLLDLGVTTIQLRIKGDLESAQVAREIRRAVAAGAAHQAHVFINDHWQLALEAGAYGVHLGQEDLQLADLNAIARAGVRLGLSTHGIYEMLLAWHFRPSYLAFGAVFPTQTKLVATDPQGLVRLAHFVDLFAAHVSTVAIGGIDQARLPQVLATGVGGVAVVSAVTGARDVPAAVRALMQAFVPDRS